MIDLIFSFIVTPMIFILYWEDDDGSDYDQVLEMK